MPVSYTHLDTYKQLLDYDNAKKCWERAYQLDKDLIDTQYSLACYYIENNLPEQAEEALNEIIAWNNERDVYKRQASWRLKSVAWFSLNREKAVGI